MANSNTIGGLHYEMMRRCYNEKSIAYGSYGAKGITVCPEWHDRETFRKWCLENGWNKNLRLNRKDSNKGYYPDNCFFGNFNSKRYDSFNQTKKRRIYEDKQKREQCGVLGKFEEEDLYRTYRCMHERCENKNHVSYKDYGGRGICVCEEWCGKHGFLNFNNWCYENKWKKGLTLDRIDNNKGYSPDNCRLVNITMQANNKRNTIYCDYLGIKVPLGIIAKNENVKYGLLYGRVRKNGMTVSEALADIKQKYF